MNIDFNEIIDKLQNLGVNCRYKECRVLADDTLKMCTEENMLEKAKIYSFLGNLDCVEGNYASALENYYKASSLSEKLNNDNILSALFTNIANVYHMLHDYNKSISYFEKSLQLYEKTKMLNNLFLTYMNMGTVYISISGVSSGEEKTNALNNAKLNIEKAIDMILKEEKLANYLCSARLTMASIYFSLGDYEKGKNELDLAKDIAEKSDNKRNLIHTLCNYSRYYRFKKQFYQAIDELKKAEEIAIELDCKDELNKIYSNLSELYSQIEDFKLALTYKSKELELSKKIFDSNFIEKIKKLETDFEIERKEKEIELHKLKNIDLVNALNEINQQKITLEELNEAKNEFLGMIVHDLRNPIACITSLCDMIKYSLNKDISIESLNKNLDYISDLSDKMYRMVSGLLNYSAIETGKIELDIKPVKLFNIIANKEFYYNELASKKDIKFFLDSSCFDATVKADSDRIAEVFDNIITNAIKFTYPGGEVKVFFEVKKDKLLCYIKDTGQGFSDKELNGIFKKYQKFKAKPTSGESSTGFGLIIINKILNLHNSEINVVSEKSIGTTFSFTLDLHI